MKSPSTYWIGQYIWLFSLCLIVHLCLNHPTPLTWAGIVAMLNWQLLVASAVGALVGLGVLALFRFLSKKKEKGRPADA